MHSSDLFRLRSHLPRLFHLGHRGGGGWGVKDGKVGAYDGQTTILTKYSEYKPVEFCQLEKNDLDDLRVLYPNTAI